MSANFADLVSHCSQFADILSWLHFSLEINVMWGQSAKHEMIVARTHKKNDKRLTEESTSYTYLVFCCQRNMSRLNPIEIRGFEKKLSILILTQPQSGLKIVN